MKELHNSLLVKLTDLINKATKKINNRVNGQSNYEFM